MTARILLCCVLLVTIGAARLGWAAEHPSIKVSAAFIDLRTGPGRGYPRVQIVERGDWLELIVHRTDWLKVRTEKGFVGWIHQDDLEKTRDSTGGLNQLRATNEGDFYNRHFEGGVRLGRFDNARLNGAYLGYYFTNNLSIEASYSEAFSLVVDYQMLSINITHQPWPEWRYSPYFGIGGGAVASTFSRSLAQTSDRTDQLLNATAGIRVYINRHLMFRGEYRNNVILTDRENNDESDEWTIGLSAFF